MMTISVSGQEYVSIISKYNIEDGSTAISNIDLNWNNGVKSLGAKNIQLSPNPTLGLFELDLSMYLGEQVDIRIYNSLGVIVAKLKKKELQESIIGFDLSNFTGTMYRVNIIINGKDKVTKKLIVLRY